MDTDSREAELLDRRASLVSRMRQAEAALDTPAPKDGEDYATERQGDEVLEALGRNEMMQLKQIDAALARITAGSYGLCLSCGEPISEARLDAVPEATLCRDCARDR